MRTVLSVLYCSVRHELFELSGQQPALMGTGGMMMPCCLPGDSESLPPDTRLEREVNTV